MDAECWSGCNVCKPERLFWASFAVQNLVNKISFFDFEVHRMVVESRKFYQTHPHERAASTDWHQEIFQRRIRFQRSAPKISLVYILNWKLSSFSIRTISIYIEPISFSIRAIYIYILSTIFSIRTWWAYCAMAVMALTIKTLVLYFKLSLSRRLVSLKNQVFEGKNLP